MTMIAYAFLQSRRLKAAGRKKSRGTAATTEPAGHQASYPRSLRTEPIPKYLLDTNVFNKVLDGAISIESLAVPLLAKRIQESELSNTRDPLRRERLLAVFTEADPVIPFTASAAWDIEGAGWNQARWNDGSGTFQKMLARLRDLDKNKRRPPPPLNQERDILTAETAIKNVATLVTDDANLQKVVTEFGGCAFDVATFLREAAKSR
jgi:predicted nucleic acid-binding protein